jgi:hypothetical protein
MFIALQDNAPRSHVYIGCHGYQLLWIPLLPVVPRLTRLANQIYEATIGKQQQINVEHYCFLLPWLPSHEQYFSSI